MTKEEVDSNNNREDALLEKEPEKPSRDDLERTSFDPEMSLMQAMLSWKFISSVIFFMFMTLRYIIFLSGPYGLPGPSGSIIFRINSFPAWHLPWLEWTFFENPDSEKIVSNCLVRFSS